MLKLFNTSFANFSFCKKRWYYQRMQYTDFSFCKKRWYHQRMQYIESHYYRHSNLKLGFLFILMNAIFKVRMKRYADKGPPCIVPLSNLK